MSDFYGLDPDLATTALAEEGEVKVFVEVAPFSEPDALSFEDDALLWGTDNIEWGKTEAGTLEPDNLPVQQIADHRLVSIPSVTSSSQLGIGFSNFVFTLRNNDDKFNSVDYVGGRCRLWSIDSTARRIVVTGRITAQTIRLATAEFTVSSLPVRELSEHFPRRKMDAETFPYGNNPGERDVPVVVGRVEFMELIKIGDKISTTLSSATSIGGTVLTLAETAGIAVGDRLEIGLATEHAEIVTVHSVDADASTVTLTVPLVNAHNNADTVTNYGTRIDYLIGEGVIPSVDDVYHNRGLTKEYEASTSGIYLGLTTGSLSLVAGFTHWIQLPEALRVSQPNWYVGFAITIGGQTATVERYEIEATGDDDEERQGPNASLPFVISFTPTSTVRIPNVTNNTFSLREYKLFDGSQDYPYPGYAFIRFAVGYSGTVHANVRGLVDETNPAKLIESMLSHSRWGVGSTVDSASFTTAATAVSDLKYEGVINTRVTVQDIIQQVARMRELELSNSRSGISLSFATARSSTVTLPDKIEEYLNPPPAMSFASLDETVEDITLRYRPGTQNDEWQGELTTVVLDLDGGLEQKLDFQNVWTTEVADRILHYYESLGKARRKRMTLTTHLLVKRGEVVTLPALSPFTTSASEWEVLEVREQGGISNVVTLASYDPNTYVYPTGRTLEEPLPIEFVPDYSQTLPPPVTNLQLSTCVIVSGEDREIYIDASWNDPDHDNYAGAIVEYRATNVEGAPKPEHGRNLRSPVRIPVNLPATEYIVTVFSQSPHNELLGIDVSASIRTLASSEEDLALPGLGRTHPTRGSRSSSTIGRWRPYFTVSFDNSYSPPTDFKEINIVARSSAFSTARTYGPFQVSDFTVNGSKRERRINFDWLGYSVESVVFNVQTETSNNDDVIEIQQLPQFTVRRASLLSNPSLYDPDEEITVTYLSTRVSGTTMTFSFTVEHSDDRGWTPPNDWSGLRIRARVNNAFGDRQDRTSWFINNQSYESFPSSSGTYRFSNFPQTIPISVNIRGTSNPRSLDRGDIQIQIDTVQGSRTYRVGTHTLPITPQSNF